MKKITQLCGFVLSGLVFFTSQASAQITLTSADLPHTGLTVETATDSTSAFIPGPAGASQTWNFSTAKKQLADEIMFLDPSTTKYASVFSKANLCDSTAGKTGSGSAINGYNFFNINSNVFEVEGSEQIVPYKASGVTVTFQVELNLNPEFVQANLPGTYGEIFNGRSRGQQVQYKNLFIYDSVKIIVNITYFDTVDAWGTLTLPTGTFNVLRKNHHEVDVDSVSEHSTGGAWGAPSVTTTTYHQYQWFTNGAGYTLAQMSVNPSSGAFMNFIWDTTAVPLGINELSYTKQVSAYPNPCSSQITFQLTGGNNAGAKYIYAYDLTGRQIDKVAMKNGTSVLNTNNYASGMYLYTLSDADGNILDRGKFSVK